MQEPDCIHYANLKLNKALTMSSAASTQPAENRNFRKMVS